MALTIFLFVAPIALLKFVEPQWSQAGQVSGVISARTRAELYAARDAAWRAYFSNDPGQLERLLGPELVAVQQHQEAWGDRRRLTRLARSTRKADVKIKRLEFPRTEVQVFGDVAILYYTYIFETASARASATDSGRATEIFARRNGRWVVVGWHLDNGAFVHRNDAWMRLP
jgi:hypothetical protein